MKKLFIVITSLFLMLFVTYSCKGNETSKDTQKNVVVENGNVVKNDEKQQIKKENKN